MAQRNKVLKRKLAQLTLHLKILDQEFLDELEETVDHCLDQIDSDLILEADIEEELDEEEEEDNDEDDDLDNNEADTNNE